MRGATFLVGLGLVLGLAWALWPATGPARAEHRPIPSLATTEGPVRILALGTSLTAGRDWPARLEERLAACSTRPVSVTKIARGGAGSDWGRQEVARQAAAIADLSPDIVLVEFSINDADIFDGVGLRRARENHLAILEELARAVPKARPVLVTMSPAFGIRGWIRPWRGDHEAAYRQLAAERGLGMIDLSPIWQSALSADARMLMPDGLHPTEAAVETVALPVLADRIGRVLEGCAATGDSSSGGGIPPLPPGSRRQDQQHGG